LEGRCTFLNTCSEKLITKTYPMKIRTYLSVVSLFSCLILTAQQPSYDSLVSFYPLNVNAKDAIGDNNGLINGAIPSTDRFGHENGSFWFNGYSDFINLRSTFDYPERTISIWFNTEIVDETERLIYVSDNPELTNGFTQIKVKEIDGKKLIRSSAGIPGGSAEGSSEINLNQWYLITLVATQDSVKHYLNGNLIGSFGNDTIVSYRGETSALLGTSRVYDRFFQGKLDDLRIYKRALSPDEIKFLYYEGNCVETVYDTIHIEILDTIPVLDTITVMDTIPVYDTVPVFDTIPVYVEISVTDTLLFNLGITGFNPLTFEDIIKVYPNPTNNYLYIETSNISGDYRIKIINSTGSTFFDTNLDQQQHMIDLSSWNGPGLYLVQLFDSHQHLIDVKKVLLE
jgi:hypothetical protein